ncbi:MAG: hypothetical protein OEY79_05165, partial [Anaplasmataceae bacterium]|nr:hypothetical protein [Anaplasmataceae bacterium]
MEIQNWESSYNLGYAEISYDWHEDCEVRSGEGYAEYNIHGIIDVVGYGADLDSYTSCCMQGDWQYDYHDICDVITLADGEGNAVRFGSTENNLNDSYVD